MQHKSHLPLDVYSENLDSINGVNFTRREIDIIACLLCARGTSKIASFLSISPKTVVNHIRNIMLKLDCNSREGIIDFIEGSNKLFFLRTHYSNLLIHAAFEKNLKAVSLIAQEKYTLKIVHWEGQDDSKSSFICKLEAHLRLAGLIVSTEVRQETQPLSYLINEAEKETYTIYILPSTLGKELHDEPTTQGFQKQESARILFLFSTGEELKKISYTSCTFIDLTKQENYFFCFLRS